MKKTKYYVYIIKCEKWKNGIFQKELYYTGMTSDPKRRLQEHRSGMRSNWMVRNNISPKYFVYIEMIGYNYYDAISKEQKLKKLTLKNKLKLIEKYNA